MGKYHWMTFLLFLFFASSIVANGRSKQNYARTNAHMSVSTYSTYHLFGCFLILKASYVHIYMYVIYTYIHIICTYTYILVRSWRRQLAAEI